MRDTHVENSFSVEHRNVPLLLPLEILLEALCHTRELFVEDMSSLLDGGDDAGFHELGRPFRGRHVQEEEVLGSMSGQVIEETLVDD